MNKELLRKKYKEIRNQIPNKDLKSSIIFEKVVSNKEFKNATVIALYSSFKDEVDTQKIIEYSLIDGKVVALSRVTENNNLVFYKISTNEELEENIFGIKEPKRKTENEITKEEINLFIVPGICFDESKNRVGFGKGYYDRYLDGTNGYKLGICFDEQISEEQIDIDKFDIKMDEIITDKRSI